MSNGDANTLYAFGYNLELTISSLRQKKKKKNYKDVELQYWTLSSSCKNILGSVKIDIYFLNS